MHAPAPKWLVVLRHAKSARPGVPDRDRPLSARGRRDAAAAGKWLRSARVAPDLVLCSPARRAVATWELAAPALKLKGPPPAVVAEPWIYDGDEGALLTVVRELPERTRTVVLVGHNPSLRELVLLLAGEADGDVLLRVREKFPTSGIAVLALAGPWSAAAPGGAVLTACAVPRG